MEDQEFILNFIKKQSLAVIATVNNAGDSESAVIGFGETPELVLIFGTSNTSRKYQNLQSKPDVSLVIGWDEGATVQYEGTATEIDGNEAQHFKEIYFTKSPDAKKYDSRPDERYFKVVPRWVRYSDLTVEPWKIVELRF